MLDLIRTACIYPIATLRERTAGTSTVLVTRYYPRGVAQSNIDWWLPDAGPTEDLLHQYRRKDINWDEFVARYIGEQQAQTTCLIHHYLTSIDSKPLSLTYATHQTSPIEEISALAQSSPRPLTLLCYEGGDEATVECHRRLLRDMVREALAAMQEKVGG